MTVYSLLSNDTSVTSITNKIYTAQAPQGTQPPYVVIDFININPESLIDDVPNIDNQYLGIECIGIDQSECINLFTACKNALEPHGYVQGTRFFGVRDQETSYYRTLFDFSFWLNR